MKALSLNRDKVLKFLSDFENFREILAIVFGINAEDMSLEHIGFMYNDEDFFETFYKDDVVEAVRATQFGDYNFMDDFVLINAYGNLDSYNDFEAMNEFRDHKEEIADAIFRFYEQDEFMCELLEECFE
jgi:hypothetical protein